MPVLQGAQTRVPELIPLRFPGTERLRTSVRTVEYLKLEFVKKCGGTAPMNPWLLLQTIVSNRYASKRYKPNYIES